MIRNGGGLIDVTLCDGFLYCASVFSKSIAKATFSFPYILDPAFGALYHVHEVRRRAGDVMPYTFLLVYLVYRIPFFATNEQKGIRHHITCSSSNLVYMIQCTKCRIQYIGETKRRLSDRFGEHRRAVEKAITQSDIDQPTAVSDHFTLPGHSLNNLELIPLELINSNRDAIRKAREAFLIYRGKTLEPSGMNRRDEI